MTYIIDNALMVKGDALTTSSLLIKNNRIDYISEHVNRLPHMKMNISQYLLTPGHVMLDFSFSPNMTFLEFKKYLQEKYLHKGCTTILFGCNVRYEREILCRLKSFRVGLLNCPIDYYLGIKIPLRALTPSFIRKCKKQKIPVVFVEIDDELKLERVQWGWIRDAVFGYYLSLVPIWLTANKSKRSIQRLNEKWKKLTNESRVPAIPYCLEENLPLNQNVLKKIGIYPAKGDIRIGGEVDYNLYDKDELINNVAETHHVDYHIHIPKVTVHKNKIIKEGNKVFFRPGFGNECIVKVPGFFQAYFDNET